MWQNKAYIRELGTIEKVYSRYRKAWMAEVAELPVPIPGKIPYLLHSQLLCLHVLVVQMCSFYCVSIYYCFYLIYSACR